jgi:prepilin-type N-terminal cleavage/methylation domain-containing protein
MRKVWRGQEGFTVIEMAVVVFVIAVLMTLALPNLRDSGEKAQRVTCEGNQRLLRAQLENYYLAERGYPTGATHAERVQEMHDRGYLQSVPQCPKGGEYRIEVAGDGASATVDCSVHGSLGA